jgi:hypothetical protein
MASGVKVPPWISNPGRRLAEGRPSETTGPAAKSYGPEVGSTLTLPARYAGLEVVHDAL